MKLYTDPHLTQPTRRPRPPAEAAERPAEEPRDAWAPSTWRDDACHVLAGVTWFTSHALAGAAVTSAVTLGRASLGVTCAAAAVGGAIGAVFCLYQGRYE